MALILRLVNVMVAINTNINALNASAKLTGNAVDQTTVMQRLSTGVRVNSAKDDAAALAISTGLVSQVKGMAQAVKNVNDGISLSQTAESALGSVVNLLQRMRELAVQSANGTLTTANRASIQLEYDANINQINTVLYTTNFNGIKLFDGSAAALQIQSGIGLLSKDTISIPKMTANSLLGIDVNESTNNTSNKQISDTSSSTSNTISSQTSNKNTEIPSITTKTKLQAVTANNTNSYLDPVYIDPKLEITGSGTIDGASVVITNPDTAYDVLMLTSPNSIKSSYDATTGILTLTGTASIADYQAALRLVQFKTDANAKVGKRDIKINLGTAIQGPNGNYYQIIGNNADWFQAFNDANNSTYFGLKGYLATVTSQVENDFIAQEFNSDSWIGATDDYNYINKALGYQKYSNQAASEGNWYWVTGPEAGTEFSVGNYFPQTLTYANWNAGEPSNSGGNENYAEFNAFKQGLWNDIGPNRVWMKTAIVEYTGTPDLHITANTNIDVGEATFTPIIEATAVDVTSKPTDVKNVSAKTIISPVNNVKTADDASQSLKTIDDALGKVTDIRTYLGAIQNSFQAVVENLTSGGTNAQQANSRLIDTDYAETTRELSRNQIISQAATAMLAQANQSSQLVLQLLKP